MFVPIEGEEHSTESIVIFNEEAKQEMTATLGSVEKGEEKNIEFFNLCEEFEYIERRVEMKGMGIQEAKLKEDEGPH
jgi:hypothetical protein